MMDSLVFSALAGFAVGTFFSVASGVVRAITGSLYSLFSVSSENQ